MTKSICLIERKLNLSNIDILCNLWKYILIMTSGISVALSPLTEDRYGASHVRPQLFHPLSRRWYKQSRRRPVEKTCVSVEVSVHTVIHERARVSVVRVPTARQVCEWLIRHSNRGTAAACKTARVYISFNWFLGEWLHTFVKRADAVWHFKLLLISTVLLLIMHDVYTNESHYLAAYSAKRVNAWVPCIN